VSLPNEEELVVSERERERDGGGKKDFLFIIELRLEYASCKDVRNIELVNSNDEGDFFTIMIVEAYI
jgi:hypothetical protein